MSQTRECLGRDLGVKKDSGTLTKTLLFWHFVLSSGYGSHHVNAWSEWTEL